MGNLITANLMGGLGNQLFETAKVELYEGQKTDIEIDVLLESKGYYKNYYHSFHSTWGDSLYFKK